MTIGIAVIGAGMAGKAHAAAYRVAPTLYESTLPDLRYVSIGDMNAEVGRAVARRYGYERSDTDWWAIADDPDIQVVSVVIANSLHLEVVRGLIEAGKHVLCEKPLSDTLASARKMADLAREASSIVASASPTAASFHQDTPSQVCLYLNDDHHPGRNGYRTVNLGSVPLRGRRHADRCLRRRLRPERGLHLPGPGLPGGGRGNPGGGITAPQRVLRRRHPQHGNPRGHRPVGRGQRKAGEPVKLGVYNAILHDRPLEEAIKVIADLGLNGIEISSGGFLPPVHIPEIDQIIADPAAARAYLARFDGTGVEIAGLNCNGNPLHPNPIIGDRHAEDVRRSIRAAAALGQNRVVTMSGLPGGEPGTLHPN